MKNTQLSGTAFSRALEKFADLALLNLLVLLCSIPVFTIGASTTALYYTLIKLIHNEDKLFRAFFRSFRQNFLQSTLLWLLLLLIGTAIVFCIWFCRYINSLVCLVIAACSLFIWCAIVSWIFPLCAKFYFQTRDAIKNAVICAAAYWPITILLVITDFLPFAILAVSPGIFLYVGFAWVVIWFSLAAFCNIRLMKHVFEALETSIP